MKWPMQQLNKTTSQTVYTRPNTSPCGSSWATSAFVCCRPKLITTRRSATGMNSSSLRYEARISPTTPIIRITSLTVYPSYSLCNLDSMFNYLDLFSIFFRQIFDSAPENDATANICLFSKSNSVVSGLFPESSFTVLKP